MHEQWSPQRLTANDRFPLPLALLILSVYVAGTLYVGLHHEPWRDEADAWLVARDLPLSEMVPAWTAHAGQPVLWYLILKVLVHAGLPYVAQTIANLTIAWAAGAVLLFAAPLTRITKILLLASYFPAYEYAVIARPYALAVLLIFLTASAWPSRHEHPFRFAFPVALLFNTNVHGAIMAALFALIFSIPLPRTRRGIGASALMLVSALVAYLQLRLPGGEPAPIAGGIQVSVLIVAVRDAFLPAATGAATSIVGLLVIVVVAIAIRRAPRALLMLIGSIGALLALYAAVWFGGLRASGMLLIAVITAIWVAADVPATAAARIAALALNTTLAISTIFTATIWKNDVAFAFSGSKEMAQFIDRRFDGYDIAAHHFYAAEALLPYLPGRRFWYVGLGQYGTYLNWDNAMRRAATTPYEAVVLGAKRHFASSPRPWLLLLNARMPQPERWGFHLIHATSVPVFRTYDERYWLYERIPDSTPGH